VSLSPEERELQAKHGELESLESQLAEQELDLATLKAELGSFETHYLFVVGVKFAQRDELEAQIAEIRARQAPSGGYMHTKAEDARRTANESANAAKHVVRDSTDFLPSERLKGLYREIAKRVHPDLSADERGRTRRNRFMSDANLAYAEGDAARLDAILEEWESSPDSVEGEGVVADLVRTIRKIHQAKKRLPQIRAEILELKSSDVAKLRQETERVKTRGRDLLAEMAAQLDADIARLRELLRSLSMEASS
jgi:hypothetical protein